MQKILLFLFPCCQLFIFAQNEPINCSAIIQQEPYLIRADPQKINQDSLDYDYEILENCGNLDSIDKILFNDAYLGLILGNLLDTKTRPITYNDLLNEINLYKATDSYPVSREKELARMTIEHKPVDLKNFEEDKITLKKTGFTDEELIKLESFLRDHASEKWDYQEAVYAYSDYLDFLAFQALSIFKFRELVDYQTALNESKEDGKKCLIYFSAYTSVNARKIEEWVLFDPKVKAILHKDYFCYIAYVDDAKKTEDGTTTVGEKQSDLQTKIFHSVSQPEFYIVNEKGEVISKQSYMLNVEEFITFLTK